MNKSIGLLLALLSVNCAEQTSALSSEQVFDGGVYISLLYAVEATGEFEYISGMKKSAVVVADHPEGKWRICTEIRCFETTFEDNVVTGVFEETGTMILNGEECEYSMSESFVLSPVDDNKVDGWNRFEYIDCDSEVNSTIEAYVLGVDIGIFY